MILVTGGTGLVGSHLLYSLVLSGEIPMALKRSTSDIFKIKKIFSYYSDNADNLFKRIRWIDGDILDYSSVLDAMEGVTHVYHCAASVSFQSSDKENLIKTNITGTANIVNAALEKRLISWCMLAQLVLWVGLTKPTLLLKKHIGIQKNFSLFNQ